MKKAERTKSTIIEAAANLFNERGYAGTSIQDIQQATGITKGGLYGHFSGKEAIAIAAYAHAAQSIGAAIRASTAVEPHPYKKLIIALNFYRDNLFEMPISGGCPIQNLGIEADDTSPQLHALAKALATQWEDRIVRILAKAEKQNLPTLGEPITYARRFIGTLEGAILMARIHEDAQYFDAIAQPLHQELERALNEQL